MAYIEPDAYITENMKKILDEDNTGKEVLVEYFSRSCFNREKNCLIGFMILNDGSFYKTRYKLISNEPKLFPILELKNLDKKNYEKHLIWSSNILSLKIEKWINLHQEEIKNLPDSISNNCVLDGSEDIIRIKEKVIHGSNIFHQIPYIINEKTFNKLKPEQKANEKGLELLSLFYKELQDFLLKELNHFNGFKLFCKKCKKDYYLPLGEQVFSVTYDFKEILYLCPNCGTWEHKKVSLFGLPRFSTTKEKNLIGDIEEEDPDKKCSKCNEYMIHYEKYNPLAFNKMICPKCNQLLEDGGPVMFN